MFHPKKDFNGDPRNTRCGENEGVFEVIKRGIQDGLYPDNARLGGRVVNGLPKPENAIAEVTVRAHESFWIIAPTGTHYDESADRWVAN